MNRLVSTEIRGSYKRLFGLIHPDRFHGLSEVASQNSESFKLLSSIIPEFCTKLEDDNNFSSKFPFALQRIRFFISPNESINHLLCFKNYSNNDIEKRFKGESVTWEEAALSLFHLLSKSKIDFNQYLIQQLYDRLKMPDQKFDNFLSEEAVKESPNIQQLTDLLRTLPMIRIDKDLSREKKLQALLSIWRSKNVLHKLHQTKQFEKVILTDKFYDDLDPKCLVLKPNFIL